MALRKLPSASTQALLTMSSCIASFRQHSGVKKWLFSPRSLLIYSSMLPWHRLCLMRTIFTFCRLGLMDSSFSMKSSSSGKASFSTGSPAPRAAIKSLLLRVRAGSSSSTGAGFSSCAIVTRKDDSMPMIKLLHAGSIRPCFRASDPCEKNQ